MSEPPPPDSDGPCDSPKLSIENASEINAAQGNRNIQGREHQAVTGDCNRINQVRGDHNWLGNTIEQLQIFLGQPPQPAIAPPRPRNEQVLLAGVKQEVRSRLRQSLHNAALINLRKEQQPEQVKHPWDAEIKIGTKPPEPLPDSMTILEVFDREEIGGKLLILGAPGSGKTTTMLDLAESLIERAEKQSDYPIPVLLNLSSWRDDRQSIFDWLVTELKSKYGVPRDVGRQWLEKQTLLPMLDALDELEPKRQEVCVEAINQFLGSEYRPVYCLVCSRLEEYNAYTESLTLSGAICLHPLTDAQIYNHLIACNNHQLWHSISKDKSLQDLAKIPLLLSIMMLAYQEIATLPANSLAAAENDSLIFNQMNLQNLLDLYISRMLNRQINSEAYGRKLPSASQTRRWLIWLAQQMQRESQTEFLIEELQPSLLATKHQKWQYRFSLGLISFSVIELLFSLTYGLVFNLIHGLIWGAAIGLLLGATGLLGGEFIGDADFGWKFGAGQSIKIPETLSWSWQRAKRGLVLGLRSGLIIGITFIAIAAVFFVFIGKLTLSGSIEFGLSFARIYIPIFGLVGALMGSLILALTGSQSIEEKMMPNWGIRKSAANAIAYGLIYSLFFGLGVGLLLRLVDPSYSPKEMLVFGLITGLIAALNTGGEACIKHAALRYAFYKHGNIPWNYARFLDYCTERLLLQRVGRRYRFIHKLLQEHFAAMPLEQGRSRNNVHS